MSVMYSDFGATGWSEARVQPLFKKRKSLLDLSVPAQNRKVANSSHLSFIDQSCAEWTGGARVGSESRQPGGHRMTPGGGPLGTLFPTKGLTPDIQKSMADPA